MNNKRKIRVSYFKRIREMRENAELTQQKVADLLNIGQRTYSDYESGKRARGKVS